MCPQNGSRHGTYQFGVAALCTPSIPKQNVNFLITDMPWTITGMMPVMMDVDRDGMLRIEAVEADDWTHREDGAEVDGILEEGVDP